MKSIFWIIIATSVCFLAGIIPQLHAEEAEQGADAGKLFETKCSTCHGLAVTQKKQKTAEDWEKTVQRMKNKKKSNISEEEAKAVSAYLAKKYGK